jgi:DNA polymerase-3 subunit epsilon/CBS domain-containing protein
VRSLDTRLLAEVVAPHLAGYSLEQLQAWLELEGSERHSALGDAALTARIFLALLPKLRDKGIRTLAEAERASRGLGRVLEDQSKAGWVDVTTPLLSEWSFGDIDSYPYRHRVADVTSAPPKFLPPEASINDALARMTRERISSLLVSREVAGPRPWPSDTGIVTERDVMRALATHGAAATDMPVGRIASRPLHTVPADALVYRAIARMSRLHVRHLGVTDHEGRVCGVVSARDLLRLRAQATAVLGDEIEQAEHVAQLAGAHGRLPHAAASLVAQGIPGRQVAVALSHELCELTRRAAVLAERRLQAIGRGDPPCRYAFAVLGSAGRGESLLAMDQDNAVVFAEGEPGGEQDRWFEQLGIMTTDILHEAGVPYCTGGVMACNPQWRGSVATWRRRIDGWIQNARPEDLLSVDIFFDLQSVHGDLPLGNDLRRYGFEAARGHPAFARLLADATPSAEPGLGLFGRIRTRAGRIDLKKSGMFGITAAARVLAICHHVTERSTPARLAGLQALGLGGAADLAALDDAHATFIDLVLRQQISDIEHGVRPTNAVEVGRLSPKDQHRLRAALDAVRPLGDLTRDLLFRN